MSIPSEGNLERFNSDVQQWMGAHEGKELSELASTLGKTNWGTGTFVTYNPKEGLRIKELNIFQRIWNFRDTNINKLFQSQASGIESAFKAVIYNSPKNDPIIERILTVVGKAIVKSREEILGSPGKSMPSKEQWSQATEIGSVHTGVTLAMSDRKNIEGIVGQLREDLQTLKNLSVLIPTTQKESKELNDKKLVEKNKFTPAEHLERERLEDEMDEEDEEYTLETKTYGVNEEAQSRDLLKYNEIKAKFKVLEELEEQDLAKKSELYGHENKFYKIRREISDLKDRIKVMQDRGVSSPLFENCVQLMIDNDLELGKVDKEIMKEV
jgi:hypothetical protein